MFCSVCGIEVNEGARFCFSCGVKIVGEELNINRVSKKEIPREFLNYVECKVIETYVMGQKICPEIFHKRAKLYEVREEDLLKIINEYELKINKFEMCMETMYEECTLFTLVDEEIDEVMQFGNSLGFSEEDIEKLMNSYNVTYHILDKQRYYVECITNYADTGVVYFENDDKLEEYQIEVYENFRKKILEFEELLKVEYEKTEGFELTPNQILLIYAEGEKLFPKKEVSKIIYGYDKKAGILSIREEIEKQRILARMTIFELYGEKVAFTEEECIGINIGKHYRKELERASTTFLKFYNKADCTKEGYWPDLNETIIKTIYSIFEGMIKNVNARNISLEDLDNINYMDICQYWIPEFERIDSEYNLICLGAEKAEYYRKLRKASRGRWSGGGFGLRGAVKGAVTASALNLATGAAHSTFNFAGNVGSEVKKLREIRKLFGSSLKNEVLSIIKSTILLIYEMELDILATYNIACNEFRLFYGDNDFDKKKVTVKMFKVHPFAEYLYAEIILELGDDNGQIDKLAQFTGIEIREMKAERKKKERAERTADGIVFTTIEEKEAYCAERKIYKPILGELGKIDVWIEPQRFIEKIDELKNMKEPTVEQWKKRVNSMLEWCMKAQKEIETPNAVYLMKLLQELKVNEKFSTIIIEKNDNYSYWIEYFDAILKMDAEEKVILTILNTDKKPSEALIFTTHHIYYYCMNNKEQKYSKFDFEQICDIRYKIDEESKDISTFEIRVSDRTYYLKNLFDYKKTSNYKYCKIFGVTIEYCINVGFKCKSKEKAKVLVQEIADMSQQDRYNLAMSYLRGESIEKNEIVAIELLKVLSKEGFSEAQWELGHYYFYYSSGYNRGYAFGDEADRERKKEEAVPFFVKAAEQGQAEALNMVASFCSTVVEYSHNSKDIPKDDKKAVLLFKEAAKQGNKAAKRNLAWHYFSGIGVTKDAELATQLLSESAELGDISAQVDLADRYKKGEGVKKSIEHAIYWYNEAANHKDAYATNCLNDFRKKYNVEKILSNLQINRISADRKFCAYCGKKILRTVKFCNFCGKNVSST